MRFRLTEIDDVTVGWLWSGRSLHFLGISCDFADLGRNDYTNEDRPSWISCFCFILSLLTHRHWSCSLYVGIQIGHPSNNDEMAKQIFIHTRLLRAYLALARLSCETLWSPGPDCGVRHLARSFELNTLSLYISWVALPYLWGRCHP